MCTAAAKEVYRENGEKLPSTGGRDEFEVPGSSKLAQDGDEDRTTKRSLSQEVKAKLLDPQEGGDVGRSTGDGEGF